MWELTDMHNEHPTDADPVQSDRRLAELKAKDRERRQKLDKAAKKSS